MGHSGSPGQIQKSQGGTRREARLSGMLLLSYGAPRFEILDERTMGVGPPPAGAVPTLAVDRATVRGTGGRVGAVGVLVIAACVASSVGLPQTDSLSSSHVHDGEAVAAEVATPQDDPQPHSRSDQARSRSRSNPPVATSSRRSPRRRLDRGRPRSPVHPSPERSLPAAPVPATAPPAKPQASAPPPATEEFF